MSSSSGDDGLDILQSVARRLSRPADADATASSSEEDDDDLSYIPSISEPRAAASKNVMTKPQEEKGGGGERVTMTDYESDDEVLTQWREKRRRQEENKRCGTTTKMQKRRGGVTTSTSTAKRAKISTQRDLLWRFSDDDGKKKKKKEERGSDDHSEKKSQLPASLQAKKVRLDEAKRGGLRDPRKAFKLPPNFEDVEFSDDERLEFLESRPKFEAKPFAPYKDIHMKESLGTIPCSIAQYLRSYQVDGVKFLHRNFVFQEGCILGDDMGLGKTVQVIAFLTAAFGKTGDERDGKRMRKIRQLRRRTGEDVWYPKALVICPSSLIRNWQNEFATWGWWNVYVYHGTKEEKEMALQAAKKGSLEVMITNYETYRLRHQDVNMVEWDCVIADECHKIKERASETTQRMNEINSLCRIGLTGTAIQNKYEELWVLLNWCRPGSIGTLGEWERTIAGPLRIGQTHDATFAQIGKARKVATMLVKNLLPRMFLRRMKALIADQLPKKSDKVVFCPLTDTQKEAYEAYLESETIQLIRDGSDPCDCGSGNKRRSCCHRTDSLGRKVNELVFPAIMWVQKLSNHLANWVPENSEAPDMRAQKLELLQTCLPDKWRELATRERLLNYMDPQMCGKWMVLQRLLAFWHSNGDKVLIFSYSLNLLHILHTLFRKTEYNVCYLDGQMPLAGRAKAVDDFNNDPDQFVFLISTKAGGVGLNITAANKVVIFDPSWNPSYDLQAQDRAYRIGQTRDVEVFRLISAGTIEEIVYARQIYKQQQANIGYDASTERRYFSGVMGDSENKGELFGLKNLFSLQENTILQEIVNKTNVAERRAGVLVADLVKEDEDEEETVDPDDEEDGGVLHALSQLAGGDLDSSSTRKKKAPRSSPPQPKNNPVAAILAEAGVLYSHENSEVIGSSKVEAQISRRALESTQDTSTGETRAFDESRGEVGVRFRPPLDVRKRQFCTAAKMLGFQDVREFALVVEGWSQKQRRRALERFYEMRREGVRIGDGSGGEGGEDVMMTDEDSEVEVVEAQSKKEEQAIEQAVEQAEKVEGESTDDDEDDDEL